LLAGPVYVDAGNPHCVFVVSGFDYDWEKVGAECQMQNRRTAGVNVEFVHARNRRNIELRIYERGVGPTPSSGSGALAAVAACFAMEFIGKTLRVTSPGGTQDAIIGDAGETVTLKAPARIIMAGVWSDGDVTARKGR
jgi:diaminopimelate epimerase